MGLDLGVALCALLFGGLARESSSEEGRYVLPTHALSPVQHRRSGGGHRPPADRLGDVHLATRIRESDLYVQLESHASTARLLEVCRGTARHSRSERFRFQQRHHLLAQRTVLPLGRLEIQRASALVQHLDVDDAVDLLLPVAGRVLDANSEQAVLSVLRPEHESAICVAVAEGERFLPSAEEQRLVGGIRLRQAFRLDEDADAAAVGNEGARAASRQSRAERFLSLDARAQTLVVSRCAYLGRRVPAMSFGRRGLIHFALRV